jgi:hypothetical protein
MIVIDTLKEVRKLSLIGLINMNKFLKCLIPEKKHSDQPQRISQKTH